MTPALDILTEGFKLPESPRWHDGHLWMADIIGRKVGWIDDSGQFVVAAEVPNRPSGLGWDPQGRLLVVSQLDALLLRLEDGELTVVSDHSSLVHNGGKAVGDVLTNDMVVDETGRAFVSSFSKSRANPSPIVRVDPDGRSVVVASHLIGPNGMVITPDGRTLIVAENGANRLVQFSITDDGRLTDEQTFAALDAAPDGIALDAEGAVWTACPQGQQLVRVAAGGHVLERLSLAPRMPLACMLGGEDGQTLFVMTVATIDQSGETASGRLETLKAASPAAGLP
jgi:sugar lactone lactonase YvrE